MSYLSYRNIPLRVLATLDLHGAVVVRVVVDGSDRDGLAHDVRAHHLDDVALHVHDQLALLELDLWQLLGLGRRLLNRLQLGRRGLALLDGRVESGLECELALIVLRTCRLRSNTATAHKRTTGQWQYPANEASGNKEGFGTVRHKVKERPVQPDAAIRRRCSRREQRGTAGKHVLQRETRAAPPHDSQQRVDDRRDSP